MTDIAGFVNIDKVIERCDSVVLKAPEMEGIVSIDDQVSQVMCSIRSFSPYARSQTAEIKEYLSRSKEERVTVDYTGKDSSCSKFDFAYIKSRKRDCDIISFYMPTVSVSAYFGKDVWFEFLKHSWRHKGELFFSSSLFDNSDGLLRTEYVVPKPKTSNRLLRALDREEYNVKLEVFEALNLIPNALISLKEKAYEMSCAYETKVKGLEINKGFLI